MILRKNLINMTIDYLNTRYPKREQYAKGITMTLISTVAMNSLKTDDRAPIQTKSNVYSLLCGRSNTGKTTMINYGLDILDEIKFISRLGDDTTAESIPSFLSTHPSALLYLPEFSKVIGSYRKKLYMSGLREIIIKIHDGTPLIQTRASRTNVEAKGYAVTCIADTQPIVIAEEATETDVQSGFLPRFIWFHEVNPEQVDLQNLNDDTVKLRNELCKAYSELYSLAAHAEISFMFSNDLLKRIDREIRPLQVAEDYHFQVFYDRITMFVVKYSMLHAFAEPNFIEELPREIVKTFDDWSETESSMSKNRKHYVVEMQAASVEWAITFFKEYCQNSLKHTLSILRISDPDKILDIVTRYMRAHNAPMPEADLYRALAINMKQHSRIQNALDLALTMNYIAKTKMQSETLYSVFDPSLKAKPIEKYASNPDEKKPESKSDEWDN